MVDPGEIVAPQRDGESNDGEPGYNDCPRLGTKSLEPLCIELDCAEHCRGGDHPRPLVCAAQAPTAMMTIAQATMNAVSGTYRWAARQVSRSDQRR
jgi:hypothetical protein